VQAPPASPQAGLRHPSEGIVDTPAEADGPGHVLRTIVLTLVAVWAAAALLRTATRLPAHDEGWRIERGWGASGVTGVPLRGAARVTAVRALLHAAARGRERWLVLLEPEVPPVEQEYLRGQLMVQEYPRSVVVSTLGQPVRMADFAGVVLPARVQVGGRSPAASLGGYSAYRVSPQ
jgi:hypothetical protein